MRSQELQAFARELAPVIAGFVGAAVGPLQQKLKEAEEREQNLLKRIDGLEVCVTANAEEAAAKISRLVDTCHQIVKTEASSMGAMIGDFDLRVTTLEERPELPDERIALQVATYLGLHPALASDEQVMKAAAAYLTANPPKDGTSVTPQQVDRCVRQWLTENPPKGGTPGDNATDEMVEAAVAKYLSAHPPEPGADATQHMVDESVSKWLTANRPKDGEPGADVTDEQVQAAVAGYLRAHPPEPGKNGEDVTPEQVQVAVSRWLSAHPPEPGKNATDEQVHAAVSKYLQAHPPAKGDDPSELEIEGAVARHLRAHPPEPGKPGTNATDEQVARAVDVHLRLNPPAIVPIPKAEAPSAQSIAAAVADYINAQPLEALVNAHVSAVLKTLDLRPEDGADATDEQVAAAVGTYLKANPPEPGKNADPVTAEQIADAVSQHLAEHPPKVEHGAPGRGITKTMVDGDGNLITVFTDGQTQNAGRVRSGTEEFIALEDALEMVRRELTQHQERMNAMSSAFDARLSALPAPADIPAAIREAAPGIVAEAVKAVGQQVAEVTEGLKAAQELYKPEPLPTFLLDQDGHLVALHKGEAKVLGKVRGSDGNAAPVFKDISVDPADGVLVIEMSNGQKFRTGRVVGKDGNDGLGFEHMEEFTEDEGRTIVRRYKRGDEVREFKLVTAQLLDAGIYKEGQEYKKGDTVSYDGSMWVAQAATSAKPGTSKDWRLGAKRGREGKSPDPVTDKQIERAVEKWMKDHPLRPGPNGEYKPFSSR